MNRRSSIPILVIAGLAVLLTIAAQHVSPDPTKPHDITHEALLELIDSLDEDSPEALLELAEELPELRMFLQELYRPQLDPPFPREYDPPYPPDLDLNRQ